MEVVPYSDLHYEFKPFDIHPSVRSGERVLSLSGDIDCAPHRLARTMADWADLFKAIVFTPGNHEFYGNDLNNSLLLRRLLEEHGAANVHILDANNISVKIDDVLFIGDTLWTDFNNGDRAVMKVAEEGMNDYVYIKDFEGEELIKPEQIYALHNEARDKILQTLRDNPDEKCYVLTHHAPTALSVPPQFLGHVLNPMYFSNLHNEIMEILHRRTTDIVWQHGHVHSERDYTIGVGERKARFVCNPRGYQGEGIYTQYTGFDEFKLITL